MCCNVHLHSLRFLLKFYYSFVCAHISHVEIRGQLLEVGSSLLPCSFQDGKAWQKGKPQSHLGQPTCRYFKIWLTAVSTSRDPTSRQSSDLETGVSSHFYLSQNQLRSKCEMLPAVRPLLHNCQGCFAFPLTTLAMSA